MKNLWNHSLASMWHHSGRNMESFPGSQTCGITLADMESFPGSQTCGITLWQTSGINPWQTCGITRWHICGIIPWQNVEPILDKRSHEYLTFAGKHSAVQTTQKLVVFDFTTHHMVGYSFMRLSEKCIKSLLR